MNKMIVAAVLLGASLNAMAETATLNIKGMTCSSCVKMIQSKVCDMDGIADCKVEVGSVVLTSKDGTKIDLEKVTEKIKEAGKHYSVVSSTVK